MSDNALETRFRADLTRKRALEREAAEAQAASEQQRHDLRAERRTRRSAWFAPVAVFGGISGLVMGACARKAGR